MYVLQSVDRHVPYLASKVFLVQEDINSMMIASRTKKDTYSTNAGFSYVPTGKYRASTSV
jgi:hypothetical protein